MIFNNGEKKTNDFPKMAKKEAKINKCLFRDFLLFYYFRLSVITVNFVLFLAIFGWFRKYCLWKNAALITCT
jgi:hypothetical protein